MRNPWSSLFVAASVAITPSLTRAATHLTDIADITTSPNLGGSFNGDGTGIWFNPLSGYAEHRGVTLPNPLLSDGKFFLSWNNSYFQPEAEVLIEGLISRGNNVIDNGFANPLRIGDGVSIGPGSGFLNSWGGYVDLGPTFGNWADGGHGYLGLTIGDGTGTGWSDVFYGYAEINVNEDYSITLLSFAYNDLRGESITTVSTIPEPSGLALTFLGTVGLVVSRRRRA
jgi:hypothetical protein